MRIGLLWDVWELRMLQKKKGESGGKWRSPIGGEKRNDYNFLPGEKGEKSQVPQTEGGEVGRKDVCWCGVRGGEMCGMIGGERRGASGTSAGKAKARRIKVTGNQRSISAKKGYVNGCKSMHHPNVCGEKKVGVFWWTT